MCGNLGNLCSQGATGGAPSALNTFCICTIDFKASLPWLWYNRLVASKSLLFAFCSARGNLAYILNIFLYASAATSSCNAIADFL